MFETSIIQHSGTLHVNDVHSKLNPSWVRQGVRPASLEDLQGVVRYARESGAALSLAGARHAIGGQQFGAGTIHVDCTGLNRVLSLDAECGIVEAEAGILWPTIVETLHALQSDTDSPWTIFQKQTGADRLTLAGAVSANIHGRGLRMRPLIGDIEAIAIVTAQADVYRCSRTENTELFRAVIGGYGLFGIVYSVTLRLTRRCKMQRVVELTGIDDAMRVFDSRIRDEFTYGDFQYKTDASSPGFLCEGVLACYKTVPIDTPIPERQLELSAEDWRNLLHLAHVDKAAAYAAYTKHYCASSGQVYWSDSMQMSTYLDDYHEWLDAQCNAHVRGTEMITEIFVPRSKLAAFMRETAADFRRNNVSVIYGTVRLIERDDESFLAWAREPWACIIFNLHVDHTPAGLMHAADSFRRLIDRAIEFHGTYYLTYHRFATPQQLLACYPIFCEFIALKRHYDPGEVFQSDWYRHYCDLVVASSGGVGGEHPL